MRTNLHSAVLRALVAAAAASISGCAADVTLHQQQLTPLGAAELASSTQFDYRRLGTTANGPMPARFVPLRSTLEETAQPKGIGLCLSGGGYRAALYSLGAVWALRDLRLLADVTTIGAVSGGAITGALVASNWDAAVGSDGEFRDSIVAPLMHATAKTIDIPAVVAGVLTPRRSVHSFVAASLAKNLYGNTTIAALMADSRRPTTRLLASQVPIGSSSDLAQATHRTGEYADVWDTSEVPLSKVVAASAAFPPFLAPARWRYLVEDSLFREAAGGLHAFDVLYVDGGVLDNLALRACLSASVRIVVDAHIEGTAETPSFTHWLSIGGLALSAVYESREQLLVESARLQFSSTDVERSLDTVERLKKWSVQSTVRNVYVPLQLRRGSALYGLTASKLGFMLDHLGVANGSGEIAALAQDSRSRVARCLAQSTRLKGLDEATQNGLVQWGYLTMWAANSDLVEAAMAARPHRMSQFNLPFADEPTCLWKMLRTVDSALVEQKAIEESAREVPP